MSEFHKYFLCPACEVWNINANISKHTNIFMPIIALKDKGIILDMYPKKGWDRSSAGENQHNFIDTHGAIPTS